mmetsp:Transcript_13255/g.45958  ORF Transcript_13255/g.45958 Transcript_13255/m.45958 type:complete len:425 (-) Transcript_13255:22-1296(-)
MSEFPAGARTLLVTHEKCAGHHIRHHPEQPRRVQRIEQAVLAAFPAGLVHVSDAPAAPLESIRRFHTPAHVAQILDLCASCEVAAKKPFDVQGKRQKAVRNIDDDTSVMSQSREAALRAVGGALRCVDAVLRGEVQNAFACVRPPGHHATPGKAMGFCLFNNVAIAALHARVEHGVKKIAIVDVDVHHGNGTEAGFAADADLLYASYHQYGNEFYPETGPASFKGCGNVINIPLKRGDGSKHVRAAFENTILPALRKFEPELVLISLGFDALTADPIGGLQLSSDDYGWMTAQLCAVAQDGRVVSVLEGGYDLNAISAAAVEHVRALIAAAGGAAAPSEAVPKAAPEAVPKAPDVVWEDHGIDSDDGAERKSDGARREPDGGLSSGESWGSGDYPDSDATTEPTAAAEPPSLDGLSLHPSRKSD